MGSFVADVSQPINIPEATVTDPSRNVTVAQDLATLGSFGLQLFNRKKAADAEEARKAVVAQGLELSDQIRKARGSMSRLKFMQFQEKALDKVATSPTHRNQLMQVVSANLAGVSEQFDEQERMEDDREAEYKSAGETGRIALSEVASGKSFSELSVEEKDDVLAAAALKTAELAELKARSDKAERTPGWIGALERLSVFESQVAKIQGAATALVKDALERVKKDPTVDNVTGILEMKNRGVEIYKNLSKKLDEQFSVTSLGHLSDSEISNIQKQKGILRDRLEKTSSFLEKLDERGFEAFSKTADILKSKHGLDVYNLTPELFNFGELMGEDSLKVLLEEKLVKDDQFRDLMSRDVDRLVGLSRFTDTDKMKLSLGIVAGIGKGTPISDYDKADQERVAKLYWKNAQMVIENPTLLDNKTDDQILNDVASVVQVLELGEERGTVEDKSRATQLLNSDGMKRLYDRSTGDVKLALGKKIIQYNVSTFGDKVKSATRDYEGIKYDTSKGEFVSDPVKSFSTGTLGDTGRLARQGQQDRKTADLNRTLRVMETYAMDDPFLASIGKVKAKDFMLVQANMPSDVVRGELSKPSEMEEKANKRGVTVQELETEIDEQSILDKRFKAIENLRDSLIEGDVDPSLLKDLKGQIDKKLGVRDAPVSDMSDLTDEEWEQFVEDEKKRRASK